MDGPPPFGLLSNPTLVVYLYQYGLGLIFLLGFTGNLASFLTFRRPVLRSTSTGWLFLVLSVSDTAFLLIEVFDFVEVGIVQAPIFLAYYNQLCRFRAFSQRPISAPIRLDPCTSGHRPMATRTIPVQSQPLVYTSEHFHCDARDPCDGL